MGSFIFMYSPSEVRAAPRLTSALFIFGSVVENDHYYYYLETLRGLQDLSSYTRDGTCASCRGSKEF